MGRIIIALLLFVALPAVAGDERFDLHAVGVIDVAPDGSVHDYELETRLPPRVAGLVDQTVRGWKFHPILVDGRPVIATTRMRLVIEAVPGEDGYALRVADVAFGEPERGANAPPDYPIEALRRGISAHVSLLLKVDASGKVSESHVERVDLSENLGKRGSAMRALFAKASQAAAAGWTFEPGETVDGAPVDMRIRVPVDYTVQRASGWRERPTLDPGPYMPPPWPVQVEADTALAGNDLQLLDPPRVTLRDDVIGSHL